MPHIAKRLNEILGRDFGIEKSYMGPFKCFLSFQKTFQKILYNVTL